MTVKLIPANKEVLIQTSAKFLSVINTTGQFEVSAPEFGTVTGKVGRQYVLDGITQVIFSNPSATDITVEYENANIEIFGSGSGSVTVENSVTVDEILTPISVVASATVDGGTMSMLSANVLLPSSKVTIAAGQNAKIADARPVKSRTVTMQVISAENTVLHIGSDNTIDNTKGVIVSGKLTAIGSAELKTESEIWLYNDSGTTATIAVMEQYINESS